MNVATGCLITGLKQRVVSIRQRQHSRQQYELTVQGVIKRFPSNRRRQQADNLGAFVIAFAIVTRWATESISLDTECDADEKATTYTIGTDHSDSSRIFLFDWWTVADETRRV